MKTPTFKTMPSKGKVIIHNLNEVLTQIKDLEPLCADYLHSLQCCEKSLIQIAVDIACVCTGDDGDWDSVAALLREGGIPLPEGLDEEDI